MKKTVLSLMTLMLVAFLGMGNLMARENSLAAGIQVGFAATGVVIDFQEGSLGLSAGLNYPIGYTYIAALGDADPEDQLAKVATVTADITTSFDLSDSFSLKLGISTIAITDFGPVFGGIAGPCLKGEYWIPNKNTGLFINLNAPIMLYGVAVNEFSDMDTMVAFNPWLPLVGLFTTTFGVLYAF